MNIRTNAKEYKDVDLDIQPKDDYYLVYIKDKDTELEKYFCADKTIIQDVLDEIKETNEADLRPLINNGFRMRTIHDIEKSSNFRQDFLEFIIYNIGVVAVIPVIIILISRSAPILILFPFIYILIMLISRIFHFVLGIN